MEEGRKLFYSTKDKAEHIGDEKTPCYFADQGCENFAAVVCEGEVPHYLCRPCYSREAQATKQRSVLSGDAEPWPCPISECGARVREFYRP